MIFEEFIQRGRGSKNYIIIRTKDNIFVNFNLIEYLLPQEVKYCVFYTNKKDNEIGMQFLKEPPKYNGVKAIHETNGVRVNIHPVLRYFGINPRQKKYCSTCRVEDKMVIFSVQELINEES